MHDVLSTRDLARLSSVTELMDRQWAPCRWNCPVHADVRGYIEAAAQGRFGDAIDIIRRNLPFAAICGRICHHPCEANCRRRDVDEPVAIREVKRYVAELTGATGATVHKVKQDKAAVAVIGGGPAGMAAALELAKKGYRPTVFEKFSRAGGIPTTAIPVYRLPREVVQTDIEWICAHGVELVTGLEIGKDKTIDGLLAEGFSAVIVAAGLAKSRPLPMPGADHKRVYPVLEYLQSIAFDMPVEVGKHVLVVGGGNVAVDAVRSALRLGAEKATLMCLEAEQEMPAWEWERNEAREEGVEFINRRGPVGVIVKNGQIVGVKARKVTRVFDENKRFNPAYDDSDLIEVGCDTVVIAIGQMADTGFAKGSSLAVDGRGRLAFSSATYQTNLPNVFACGEIVTAPGSAVEACASGQRAALAADQFLSGKPIVIDTSLPPCIDRIEPLVGEKVTKVAREKVPVEPPEIRRKLWTEMDHNYAEPSALAEARRCMNCGAGAEVLVDKCAACLTCLRVCPFGVPKVTDVAVIESTLCQACGMCVAECPANAIIFRGKSRDELAVRTAKLLAGTQRRVIAYICGHHASAEDWKAAGGVPGVTEVYIPSVAGVGVSELLGAIEQGAEGVLVIACKDGSDRYPKANQRLRARVAQAQAMLSEIGLKPEMIKLVELA